MLRQDPALTGFLPEHLREPARPAVEANLKRRVSRFGREGKMQLAGVEPATFGSVAQARYRNE
jgi:hypothetical protein